MNDFDIQNVKLHPIFTILNYYICNSNVLLILRGAPGSGKSTLAKCIKSHFSASVCEICSADDFFYTQDGHYVYDPSFIQEAHSYCRKKAFSLLEIKKRIIIIDNTNIRISEFIPYLIECQRHSYLAVAAEPITQWRRSPQELSKRTVHSVPKRKVREMVNNFERIEINNKTNEYFNGNHSPAAFATVRARGGGGGGGGGQQEFEILVCLDDQFNCNHRQQQQQQQRRVRRQMPMGEYRSDRMLEAFNLGIQRIGDTNNWAGMASAMPQRWKRLSEASDKKAVTVVDKGEEEKEEKEKMEAAVNEERESDLAYLRDIFPHVAEADLVSAFDRCDGRIDNTTKLLIGDVEDDNAGMKVESEEIKYLCEIFPHLSPSTVSVVFNDCGRSLQAAADALAGVQAEQDGPDSQQERQNPEQDEPIFQQDKPNPEQDEPNLQQERPNPEQDEPNPQQERPNPEQDEPNPQQEIALPDPQSLILDRPEADQSPPPTFNLPSDSPTSPPPSPPPTPSQPLSGLLNRHRLLHLHSKFGCDASQLAPLLEADEAGIVDSWQPSDELLARLFDEFLQFLGLPPRPQSSRLSRSPLSPPRQTAASSSSGRLLDIMAEERANRDSFGRLSLSQSSRLSLDKLSDAFPSVQRDTLLEVYKDCGLSYEATHRTLMEFGHAPTEFADAWTPAAKKWPTVENSVDCGVEFNDDNSSGGRLSDNLASVSADFRRRRREQLERSVYCQEPKAQAYYAMSAGELAQLERNRRRSLLEASTATDEVDLHGMTCGEAIAAAKAALDGSRRTVKLITGHGRHSNSGAVLRPVVKNFLKQKNYQFEELHLGCFQVRVT